MDWPRKLYLFAKLRHNIRKISSAWADLPAAGAASDAPRIFLFSRYGTETVGNHFIQLGLLRVCFHTLPEHRVYLLSSRPHSTEKGSTGIIEILKRTTAGLPLARFVAERVTVLEEEGIRALGRGDLLVLGGGPSLHCEDFVSLSNLIGFDSSDDRPLNIYATAMRRALTQ